MEESAEEIYNTHCGKQVLYKGVESGWIAGFASHYVIIGFLDNTGCVKSFTNHVKYELELNGNRYQSYRFAKPKNISLKDDMTVEDFLSKYDFTHTDHYNSLSEDAEWEINCMKKDGWTPWSIEWNCMKSIDFVSYTRKKDDGYPNYKYKCFYYFNKNDLLKDGWEIMDEITVNNKTIGYKVKRNEKTNNR